MQYTLLIGVVGFTILSCGKGTNSNPSDQISGAYAREYAFKVINPETGAEVGTRTVRDTIFVRQVEKGYLVSNRKWKEDDYDTESWKNLEHSDDRPFPMYNAVFHVAANSLNAELTVPLYLNQTSDTLYRGKPEGIGYFKVSR